MITTWQHVRPGALVLLRGRPYWVTARTGDLESLVTITVGPAFTQGDPQVDRKPVTATVAADKSVIVLQPGDEQYVPSPEESATDAMLAPLKPAAQLALASATLAIRLGATTYATLDPTGRTLPVAHVLDRWHLYLFHGITDEVPSDASPQVIDTLHESTAATKPHTHAPLQ